MGALKPLIAEARAKRLWLWCHYQDLWFSPAELEAQNNNGKFLWSAENWRLRDPNECLQAALQRLAAAEADVRRIRDRINGVAVS